MLLASLAPLSWLSLILGISINGMGGEVLLQEHLQAAAKNHMGADHVGIVQITRQSPCPRYAV